MSFSYSVSLRYLANNFFDDFPIFVNYSINRLLNDTFNNLFYILWHLGVNDFFDNLDFRDFNKLLLFYNAYFPSPNTFILREIFENGRCDKLSKFLFLKLRFECLVFNIIILHLRYEHPLVSNEFKLTIIRLEDS